MGRTHRLRAPLAAATAALLILAGCASGGRDDKPSSPAAAALDQVETFAFALGVDADDPEQTALLLQYDLIVVDGEETSAETIAALHTEGAVVLAYLSVGTVEPQRRWFDEAERERWLLDRWEDWDEWYADVNQPGLRRLLVEVGEAELSKGFDGLFLDNTDMVTAYEDQAEAMALLVADLASLNGGETLVFAQNGDPEAAGILDDLDGWNREDVSFTYDFETEMYQPVPDEDHDAALAVIERVSEAGVLVTATDYLSAQDLTPPSSDAIDAIATACSVGAIGYVGDIGLTTLGDQPWRCD